MTTLIELVDERVADVDRWWDEACADLMARHGAKSLYDVPRAEWWALSDEYLGRLRIAWFRDPETAEATPERRAIERQERREEQGDLASQTGGVGAGIDSPSGPFDGPASATPDLAEVG